MNNLLLTQAQTADFAQNILAEYGIIGLAIFALGFFAWHQHKTLTQFAKDVQMKSDSKDEKLLEISNKQTLLQERQANLLESQTKQTKEFYDSIMSATHSIPREVVREINYDKIAQRNNGPK